MAGRLHGKVSMSAGTVWPSGLRRWLQAPVRKGVGSNPTAVTFCVFAETCSRTWPAHCKAKGRDDLGVFSTQTPLMIVFIKCSKSSRAGILQSLAPRARQTELRGGLPLLPRSCARQEPVCRAARAAALKLFK